jgi:hypothetical protein
LPLRGNLPFVHVRIDGSILILPIFQKEEMAGTDAKEKMRKVLFDFQSILNTKRKTV